MKRYKYKSGPYREFRGYVFVNGQAVEIRDEATKRALAADPNFEEVKDEEEAQAPAEAPVLKRGRGRPPRTVH